MNNTKSSVKNRLKPNSNCLPRGVEFHPAQEKLGLHEAPSSSRSIQRAYAYADWTTTKFCHDPCFAQCGHLLHIGNQNPRSINCIATYLPHYPKDFSARLSGDDAAAVGQAGVGIALSQKAESALLDWIPVNSRLCAARLNGSVKANKNRSTRTLLVISVYAPTGSNDDDIKNQFFADLNDLLHFRKASDIVMVAGGFNAQMGHLSSSERNIGGRFSLNTRHTDNGERLLDFCSKHGLYLVSANHRHKKSHPATWRSADPHHTSIQIDHIAISSQWRGSVQDCRSIWSTPLDSDHAFVLARFVIQFPGSKISNCHSQAQ